MSQTYYILVGRRWKTTLAAVNNIIKTDEAIFATDVISYNLSAGYVGGSNLGTTPTGGSIILGYNPAFEAKDDVYNHAVPTPYSRKRTRLNFYSGKGQVIACTTVNASTTVTTGSTAGLVAGQGVSGTGIPTGATIVSVTNATTFVISAPATASATNNLTFDDGILLGYAYPDSDYISTADFDVP